MNPHDCEEDYTPVFDQIPMKLKERLKICPQKREAVGWGLQIVEGLNPLKFWLFGCLGFLLCCVFAVVWSAKVHDLQGGFAVTSCLILLFSFTAKTIRSNVAGA